MIYRFQYWLTKALVIFLRLFPLAVSYSIARFVGGLFFYLMPKRRQIAYDNLETAFGDEISEADKNAIARKVFQHTAISILELYIVEKVLPHAEKRFEFANEEHIDEAFAHGKGVVLITSHLGSWEYLSFLHYLKNKKCSVIVKKIRNPYIDKEINRLRRAMKLNPLDKESSVRRVFRELNDNNQVAILIDQWAGPDGIWIDFFGKKTSTTSMPARLAEKTGCALLPAFCIRQKDGFFVIKTKKPIFWQSGDSEKSMTERLNGALEETIKEHPEQWTWGHRRWKPQPKFYREAQ